LQLQCTKFDDTSFNRSRDMTGDPKKLNGSREVNTPLSGVCHPLARTCFDQPSYWIWSMYLHPL